MITTAGPSSLSETLTFAYYPSDGDDANDDGSEFRVSRVKFNRGGADVRTVEYEYWGQYEADGQPGDVKNVTIHNGSETGDVVERYHYRYSDGRLSAAYSTAGIARVENRGRDFFGAYSSEFEPYADYLFTYDADGRVATMATQGSGGGGTTLSPDDVGAQGTYTFGYEDNEEWRADGYNVWKYKTTVTKGNVERIVYSNFAGEVILDVTSADGKIWRTANRFDQQGRPKMSANPSAISGFDETLPDLLDDRGSAGAPAYQHVENARGLIEKFITPKTSRVTAGTPNRRRF